MDDVELDLLEQLTKSMLDEVEEGRRISIDDLSEWHRRWLGNVYVWAGGYRSVNIGKRQLPVCRGTSCSRVNAEVQ
jgi:cell filamentation protein